MIFAFTAFKGFTIDESFEVDRDAIAFFRGCASRLFPRFTLLTERCDHFFNVSRANFALGLFNLITINQRRIKFREYFKCRLERKI